MLESMTDSLTVLKSVARSSGHSLGFQLGGMWGTTLDDSSAVPLVQQTAVQKAVLLDRPSAQMLGSMTDSSTALWSVAMSPGHSLGFQLASLMGMCHSAPGK
jgi:hypothetical protein